MYFNVSIKSAVRTSFYLILIGVSITSWIKLLEESTALEEKVVYNKTRLPSFTLCPTQPDDPIRKKSIESFQDIENAIKNVRHKYTIEYMEYKPYEQNMTVEINSTDSSYGDWYFAPKISLEPPFEIVICLIWTPTRDLKIKPDWSILVS